jgi:hypothetical protein
VEKLGNVALSVTVYHDTLLWAVAVVTQGDIGMFQPDGSVAFVTRKEDAFRLSSVGAISCFVLSVCA